MGLGFGKELPAKTSELLRRAQQGDQEARAQVIRDCSPFIVSSASHSAGRFLRAGHDEEISVALMAFDEAISSYKEDKGKFLSFAGTVIKRRLVDYYRQQGRRPMEVPFSAWESAADRDTGTLDVVWYDVSRRVWEKHQDEESRRSEIIEYGKVLQRYGLSWDQLIKSTPKHQDSRRRAIQIGRIIAAKDEYRLHLLEKSELPLSRLVAEQGLSRKILERHRKYIAAVALLLSYDFPYLKEYLSGQ
ncbi:MAG: RNA polymerase sigma-I factor [Sulfobacillus benefaciens]|uniref:RNA polymerase sigma factor SigI n=1 Tax=Sulfobacillus benefaciens TaxID=453960 RepID=A0A2T2XDN3_9FIRM|nr:MAG: RNA polymerase sigma-I factor [Sulfobacillus benefaciens]